MHHLLLVLGMRLVIAYLGLSVNHCHVGSGGDKLRAGDLVI